MAHAEELNVQVIPADKGKIWKIWKTAIMLAVITLVEFAFAFTMSRGTTLTIIFIVLTIAKAFFIVGEFMHLKHEAKSLIWSILLPVIFLCWLILAMKIEGNEIFDALNIIWQRWF